MATINNQSPDEDRRREIALELMEAYVSLTCCCIFLFNYVFPFYYISSCFFILDMFSLATVKNSEKEAIHGLIFTFRFL